MGGSWSWFAVRRLVALAVTVVLAPTLVWTVFNGLRGTGGQSLPGVAGDYLVATYWHFDLGQSSAYSDSGIRDVMIGALPADLGLVLGGVFFGVVLGMADAVPPMVRSITGGGGTARMADEARNDSPAVPICKERRRNVAQVRRSEAPLHSGSRR